MKNEQIDVLRKYSRDFVRELGLLSQRQDALDLSHTEGHILIELGCHGSMSGKELASKLLVDKSLISKLLVKLNKRGYTRFGTNTDDQRVKPVHLTKMGRGKLDEIDSFVENQVRLALGNLGNEDVETVTKGLKIYSKALSRARILNAIILRKLKETKSPAMEKIILKVSGEYNSEGFGGPMDDIAGSSLFQLYGNDNSFYYVALPEGKVIGGAGIT